VALKLFKSCISYFGGKKGGIALQIMRHVPPPSRAPVFIDAFAGACSMSLLAKHKGHRVLANDLADRSVIAGRALIQNGGVKLTEGDLQSVFTDHPGNTHLVERRFTPKFFLLRHARLLDRLLANARASHCPARRDLLLLAAMHFVLRVRPFGDFNQANMAQRLLDGETEGINPKVYKVKLGSMLRGAALPRLRVIASDINAAVCDNGHANEMCQLDVLDFVRQVRGDCLYLDPPYWGSNAYEKVYAVLDQIIEGRDEPRDVSRFNRAGADAALDALFESSAHIPLWVLSFGGGKLSTGDCLQLIRRHRPAEAIPVSHRYVFGDAGGQDASAKEILIVARREGDSP
jgi:hypothetical protein